MGLLGGGTEWEIWRGHYLPFKKNKAKYTGLFSFMFSWVDLSVKETECETHKGTCLNAEPHVSVGSACMLALCMHVYTQTPTPMCTQACMHACTCMCARTGTHTHTHIYMHACMCIHADRHAHVYAHAHTHPSLSLCLRLCPSLSYKCMYTETHTLTHTDITQRYMHACTYAHTCMHTCTCKRACTHGRTHTHTHTHTHACTKTHKHMYAHVERERDQEVFEVLTSVAITCWLSLSWQMLLVDRWRVRSRCCGRCWGARCAEPPSWSAIWESRRLRNSNTTCRRASTRSRSPRRTYLLPNGGCWCYEDSSVLSHPGLISLL